MYKIIERIYTDEKTAENMWFEANKDLAIELARRLAHATDLQKRSEINRVIYFIEDTKNNKDLLKISCTLDVTGSTILEEEEK